MNISDSEMSVLFSFLYDSDDSLTIILQKRTDFWFIGKFNIMLTFELMTKFFQATTWF